MKRKTFRKLLTSLLAVSSLLSFGNAGAYEKCSLIINQETIADCGYVDDNMNVYLPVRAVAESFGNGIMWNGERQTVTISTPKNVFVTRLGSRIANKDWTETVVLDLAPKLINNSTMVSANTIEKLLDIECNTDLYSHTVMLSKKSVT